MTETRKEYRAERYFAGELRPDQEKSWRADDGIFVKYELFEQVIVKLEKKLKQSQKALLWERSLNGDLRHFIEDRIMDDKDWQIEYEVWLNKLNGGERE